MAGFAADDEPSGTVVARPVPGVAEARDLHVGAGVRRVDEAAAADVHADMADAVEEDEIARAKRLPRDPDAEVVVGVGAVREREAEVGVDETDEVGAPNPVWGESPPQRYGIPSSRRAY